MRWGNQPCQTASQVQQDFGKLSISLIQAFARVPPAFISFFNVKSSTSRFWQEIFMPNFIEIGPTVNRQTDRLNYFTHHWNRFCCRYTIVCIFITFNLEIKVFYSKWLLAPSFTNSSFKYHGLIITSELRNLILLDSKMFSREINNELL